MQAKALTIGIVLYFILALTSNSRLVAADIIVGLEVAANEQIPLDQIDHSAWDGLLKKYVDDKGMVNYQALKASSEDSRTLDQYLINLSQSNGKGTKEQQLVFWINAYNAVTVKGIGGSKLIFLSRTTIQTPVASKLALRPRSFLQLLGFNRFKATK